jgi:ribonuclease HII
MRSADGLLFHHERNLLERGVRYIAGVDEVGRGALAGPLVVGAVILQPEHLLELKQIMLTEAESTEDVSDRNNDVEDGDTDSYLTPYTKIKDSKKLTPKRRGELADFIRNNALGYAIEIIENTKVDRWGIAKSTQIAFYNSLSKLPTRPQHILTDTFPINVVGIEKQTNIKNGDNVSVTIAAASIVAKVFRDELMIKLHEEEKYRVYCFNEHKGYGTKKHLEAIRLHGACDLHRLSFKPLSYPGSGRA